MNFMFWTLLVLVSTSLSLVEAGSVGGGVVSSSNKSKSNVRWTWESPKAHFLVATLTTPAATPTRPSLRGRKRWLEDQQEQQQDDNDDNDDNNVNDENQDVEEEHHDDEDGGNQPQDDVVEYEEDEQDDDQNNEWQDSHPTGRCKICNRFKQMSTDNKMMVIVLLLWGFVLLLALCILIVRRFTATREQHQMAGGKRSPLMSSSNSSLVTSRTEHTRGRTKSRRGWFARRLSRSRSLSNTRARPR